MILSQSEVAVTTDVVAQARRLLDVGRYRVTRHDDIRALRDRWHGFEALGAATVFQSRPWLAGVADAARAGALGDPFIIMFESVASGMPVMLLPLVRSVDRGVATVSALDLGVSDYNAPLVVPGADLDGLDGPTILRAVKGLIGPADLLRIDKMPARFAGVENPLLRCAGVRPTSLTSCRAELLRPWAERRRDVMLPRFVEEIDDRWRRFCNRGVVDFTLVDDDNIIPHVFAELARQRAARFAKLRADELLSEKVWYDFYLGQALAPRSERIARLFSLSIDGEIVATLLGLEYGDTFHVMLPTFKDGVWRNYSPGLLMITRTMDWAVERGFRTFDFTIGAETYKSNFGVGTQTMYELVEPLSPRGLLPAADAQLRGMIRARPRVAAVVRNVLRYARR